MVTTVLWREGERRRGERQEVRKGRDKVMGGRQRRRERRNTGRRKAGSKSKQKKVCHTNKGLGRKARGKESLHCTYMYMHVHAHKYFLVTRGHGDATHRGIP